MLKSEALNIIAEKTSKCEECDNCRKYLEMQIKCINPEWILCFGENSFSESSGARCFHNYWEFERRSS